MFKKRWIWILLLVIAVTGLFSYFWVFSGQIVSRGTTEIETAEAKTGNIEDLLIISGNYLYQKSNIISRVSGNIGFIKEGEFNKGDLLVKIDSDEFMNQEASLNSKFKQSLININKMNDRITSSVRDVGLAKMSLESNQNTLNSLENKVEGLKMVAPFNGVIYESKYRQGDYVTPSVSAISMYQSDTLFVLLYIPEKDKSPVAKATSIELTFFLKSDTVYSGTIQEMGNLVELDKSGQRTVKVKIKANQKIDFPIFSSVSVQFKGSDLDKVYSGYLESDAKVMYTPRLTGEVVFIETPGRAVTKGALLIQLKSEDLESQIEQQKRTIKQMEANLKKAEEGVKSLKQDLEILNLQYQELLLQEQSLIKQKQNYEITAGSEGRVLQRNGEIGDSLTPGQVLLIIEKGKPFVRGYLGEEEYTRASKGMNARVIFLEQVFSGKVSEISSIAQSGRDGSNVYYVKIEIDHPLNIPDNAGVEINIVLEQKEKVLTIPSDALIYRNNDEYVFKWSATKDKLGKISLVKVKTGLETNGIVEVLEGILVGDTVIVNPVESLKDGMMVRIKTP